MTEAEELEAEIMEKALKLAALRAAEPSREVRNYEFETLNGKARLANLFAGRDTLLMIHNMGQGCRYCTTWADGVNGILRHLEDAMSVVLVSKDPPETQRRLAEDRGWRLRMASHGGGDYIVEQSVVAGERNMPGAVIYHMNGGKIMRRGRAVFGPGDLYSPLWHFLALAGVGPDDFTPQFHYWSRPQRMDDGGQNLRG